jgi:ATP-dependent Clp protease, proteolytic subunit ClpP
MNWVETPKIITETSNGYDRSEILDVMFQNREIECVGEITESLSNSLCRQLRYLEQQDDKKEITIFINTPGGSVDDGLAVIDVINAIKCPINTICIGKAYSMGALIFVSGTKGRRFMLPHSRIMVHDPLIMGGIGGSALAIKSRSDDMMRIREITAEILAKCTGIKIDEIYKFTAHDSYFEALEAVSLGFADEVMTKF